MVNRHKLGVLVASISIGLALAAGCGGRSKDSDEPGNNGGAGGMPTTQGGEWGVMGGNSASGGSIGAGAWMAAGGSAQGGSAGCVYGAKTYKVGETFKAGDGCNTCTCFEPNTVGCTLVDCPDDCSGIQSDFVAVIEDAKRCNPALGDDQCRFFELPCDCPTFVNNENRDALEKLADLRSLYAQNSCDTRVTCTDCPQPHRGYCSAAGRCEDSNTTGTAACVVDGTTYPHGATGIKDPFSCNRCECFDGSLGCTEIGCETACPPDTIAGSRCIACTPFGGCTQVETACVQPCEGSCAQRPLQCIGGTCQVTCPIRPI